MPRQKLSEIRAKTILSKALGLAYEGWSIDTSRSIEEQLKKLPSGQKFVIKVDQGVKGRFKKGLVSLDLNKSELPEQVEVLKSKGYRWLIVEPMHAHKASEERYLSLALDRNGVNLSFTSSGGVDVESRTASIRQSVLGAEAEWAEIASQLGLSESRLRSLYSAFCDNYFAFMEINPYVAIGDDLRLLDAAVEVDDTAAFFVDSWAEADLRSHTTSKLSPEETVVHELDVKSPASLKLSLLEPNGQIFVLLSGGGASVAVADEIYNQGYGKALANYGEYSGNPNAEETYIYSKQLLQLLLKSKAQSKILFIGGAVANFTDVAKTFTGIIQAIDETAEKLKADNVKVFVRRGGPNQEAGLAYMDEALRRHGLLGAVHDPSMPLIAAVDEALQGLSHV